MTLATTLRTRFLGVGLILVALASGCGDGPAGDEREVGIYSAAIRWLVDQGGGDEGGTVFEETVYVEAVGDEDIPLSVQAAVVARLEDFARVRFIDARDEAIDTAEPGDPVRGGGLLIGLGPVRPRDGSPVRLYADRYAKAEHEVAYDLSLEPAGDRWRVVGPPERVTVRERDPAAGD